jgi:cupin fold WbuC family metalloprotein
MPRKNPPLIFRPIERSGELKRLFLSTENALKSSKREHVVVKGNKVFYKAGNGYYSVRSLGGLVKKLKEEANADPRKRKVLSFSPKPPEGVEKVYQFNFIKPGSYLQFHTHTRIGEKWMVVRRGKFKAIIADETGKILQTKILTSKSRPLALKTGTYHTLVALTRNSVLFEEVPAKYDPANKVPAAWAPKEGTPEAEKMLKMMRKAVKGQTLVLKP